MILNIFTSKQRKLRGKLFDLHLSLVFLVEVEEFPGQDETGQETPNHQDEEGALHVGDSDHGGHGDSTSLN